MFTNPKDNVHKFFLSPGHHVADLGAGPGSYTIESARIVGEKGRVYAIDIQKDILSSIKKTAEKNSLFNIDVIWGDVEEYGGTKLADSSIDVAIVSNLLFQIEDKDTFLKEIYRILKPSKGKVCVIEWTDSFGGLGPHPSVVIDRDMCINLFEKSGMKFLKELSSVGAHHYGLVFEKK